MFWWALFMVPSQNVAMNYQAFMLRLMTHQFWNFFKEKHLGQVCQKICFSNLKLNLKIFFHTVGFFFKVGVQLRLKVFIFSQLVTFEVQKTKPREYATVKSMWMVKIAIAVFLERGI